MPSPLDALRRCLFLVSLPMVYISFALPLRASDLGASALEIGGLFSIFTISLLVLRPLVGIGLDHFGRRRFFLLALIAYTLSNSIYVITSDLSGMYFARFLQGIAASLLLITTDTITTDLTNSDNRAHAMGANVESQSRGGMAGAFVGFALVGAIPLLAWQYAFTGYAVFTALALLFAYRGIPETSNNPDPTSGFTLRFTLPRQLRGVMLIVFISGFANALIQPIYLIFLRDRFNVEMLILVWAFLPSGIVYATLPSRLGKLSDRWGRATTVALGLSIAGILYLALPLLPSLLWIAVFYTIGHVGWAMADPARNAWIGDLSEEGATGRTFGISQFFASLGASVGPLVGGFVYDNLGQTLPFFMNGALLTITGAAIFLSSYYATHRKS